MSILNLKLAKSTEDLKFLYDTRTDPLIDKMLSGEAPKNFSQHENYIKKNQEKTRWIYIALSDTGDKIGYSQVYDVRDDQLEVGFAIAPNNQGKGFGKKIVQETIKKAKEVFPGKRIILYVKEENKRAIHIYKKYGFVEKDTKKGLTYMEFI